jgi:hypothetical protein
VPSGYVVPSDASVFFQPPKLHRKKRKKSI